MASHVTKGQWGEELAAQHLLSVGHTILFRNWRVGHKEIDIISLHQNVLVFTEVKTRTSFDFGYPEQAVSLNKQKNLKEAASAFMLEYEKYTQLRFDIISLIIKGSTLHELKHIEDAFY